jgi:mRNA-degrading endonuclease RelE of RelBE toxin-antitoxin system
MKWEEKDFEAEIKKLEKEAESRLDAKIKELEANIEKVGKP